MKQIPHAIRPTLASRGFTLIELMISIGIALLLMIGVGGVFRIASDTIGMGQALSNMGRNGRATLSTMNEDFENFATDGPILMIQSGPQIGFLDSNAYQANPTIGTFDATQSGTATSISQALNNDQVHRMDVLAFCTRCKYMRKASASGPTDQTSSAEAFVWWGHLAMLDNSYGTYWTPAQGDNNTNNGGDYYLGPPSDNPNNFYGASQWTLGRVCILLRPDAATADPAGGYFPSGNSTGSTLNPSTNTLLAPLQGGTTAIVNNSATSIPIESNVIDFAQTNIRTFRDAVIQQQNYSSQQVYGYIAWDMFLGGMPTPSAPSQGPAPIFPNSANNGSAQYPWVQRRFNARNWVRKALVSTPGAANETVGNVYTPFDQISQMSAAILPGCTQFIVEYAGDYLNQDPVTGKVINIWGNGGNMGGSYSSPGWNEPKPGPTDGKLDFVVDADGSHRIRWYGFPRDVAGDVNTNRRDGTIPTNCTSTSTAPPSPIVGSPDVVPLRDLMQCAPANTTEAGTWHNMKAPFEKTTAEGIDSFPTYGPDYAASFTSYSHYQPYTCVWGPNDRLPWLIRVTIEVHDPNNRVQGGQTYEYVFALPH